MSAKEQSNAVPGRRRRSIEKQAKAETPKEEVQAPKEKVEKVERVVPALLEKYFQLAEAMRNEWHVTPPAGTLVSDMEKGAYWAHLAKRMTPGDIIQANAEDGSFWAEFLVQQKGDNWVKVVTLRRYDLDPSDSQDSVMVGKLRVEYAGTYALWRIVNTENSTVLREQIKTKEQAIVEATHLVRRVA